MNWQHLIYFKTVAKVGNYAQAAEELYITSSALSKAIHALEDELGFPLLQKSGRKSQLTSYGKTFYQCVEHCSTQIEECIKKIYDELNVVSGHICVEGIYTMCAEYLPTQIRIFKTQHPNISVSMEYHTTSVILQHLLKGMIDMGFCGNFDIDNTPLYSGLERVLIRREDLIILLPQNHRLAARRQIDFSELSGETFVVHKHKSTGTGSIFTALCEKHGFSPTIGFEVPDDQSILGLVRNGLGIALIADSPSLKAEGTVSLPLRGEKPVREQYVVWKKGYFLSPVAKAFLKQVIGSIQN